ncbi:hypothetical protein KSP39_PZI001709 [Platanthera zijinensis]|uniref:Uncharacterized protein n=1 Tax=Platanthera zijinensis TaxID=2320716 RepID=A0AAP0BYU6_9ASPA
MEPRYEDSFVKFHISFKIYFQYKMSLNNKYNIKIRVLLLPNSNLLLANLIKSGSMLFYFNFEPHIIVLANQWNFSPKNPLLSLPRSTQDFSCAVIARRLLSTVYYRLVLSASLHCQLALVFFLHLDISSLLAFANYRPKTSTFLAHFSPTSRFLVLPFF